MVRTGWLVLAGTSLAACDGVVGAEVECEKICITSAGPTVPGLGVSIDAGLPAGLATRPATMEFNVPLAQLSKAVGEVDVEASLSALRLMASTDLAFVDTAQVILRAGTADGGVRPADAGARDASPPIFDAGTPPPVGPAGGGMPIMADDLPNVGRCLPGGPGLLVATYRKPSTATAGVGRAIDLVLTTRGDDVYRCLRGVPAQFAVVLGMAPAYLPAADTPVSLKVCISASAGASFP